MKRRILAFLFAAILIFTSFANTLFINAFAEEPAPLTEENRAASEEKVPKTDPIGNIQIDSQGACLYNLETGVTLYDKNANTRMCPASTTKIMTALVVLDNCADPKSETMTVDDTSVIQYIIDDGGMNMDMKSGEVFNIYDLLVGMMINSFCDAAEMLAYKFGGNSVPAFIEMMNNKAKELGLENTHFENPHGLEQSNHYSSPADMTKIMAAAIKNPQFVEIIQIRNYTIPATNVSAPRVLNHTVSIYHNSGKYAKYYLDSYIGGKSGFTDEAGRCLVTYASKDGVSYILTLFGANRDQAKSYPESNMTWYETFTLLSYAYENFEIKTVFKENQTVKKLQISDSDTVLDIIAPNDILVIARKGEEADYTMELPDEYAADKVKDGIEMGFFNQRFNERNAEKVFPLILKWDGSEIKVKSVIQKATEKAADNIKTIFTENKTFTVLVIALLIVIALIIPIIKVFQYLRDKENNKPKH